MSRAPKSDPRRLQGIPRVQLIHATRTSNYDDADDAVFLASQYGLIPDPWQINIIRPWMCRRRDGRWVHPSNGLAVPRQNGKNGAVEVRELFGLIELGEAILHTAHEIKTAKKAFKRLKHFFGEKDADPHAKFPELNALVAEVRNANGQEAIVLKDIWVVDGEKVRSKGKPKFGRSVALYARGGFIEFATRTGAGGRGTTYDLLIVDEAQHLSDEDLTAVRPTISAGALGNSQIIYLGTPPDPEKLSNGIGAAWTRIRARAKPSNKRLCWIEYSVPDGPLPDIDNIELLYQVNPALGVVHGNGSHGLDFETIQGERDELDDAGFARERYGWWGNPDARGHRGVIDMDQWARLRVAGDTRPSRGLAVIDCHPKLTWTSIAVATDGPDKIPLGLIYREAGTTWPVARMKKIRANLDRLTEVALTPSAKIFGPALRKAGFKVVQLTRTDVGTACASVQKMITAHETTHVGQGELDQAARAAITRMVGDTQQWDRSDQRVDISPLVAYSIAVHRWTDVKPPPPAPEPVTAKRARTRHAAREPDIAKVGF